MRFFATILVAFALPLSFAGSAEATRPIPGFHYKDVCHNIKGKQPIYLTVGSGPYRLDTSTARKHDCIRSRMLR